MTYTGQVTPGGPADIRELTNLTIAKVAVSEMNNNVYLLTCRSTGKRLLIDAADDAPRIEALLGDGRLAGIVTTHQHWDHHRALTEVVAATHATTAAGEADADALPVIPDQRLSHGDHVRFGDIVLDVVHLRGHTPGSVALAYDDRGSANGRVHLWTGDSLFPGGVGNTQKDPARFAQLIDDVEHRIFDVYDDDTWVYPGHGADTTLGAERADLPQWRRRGW